ncbi:MAG: hypothetical protein AB1568_04655 [Thermodesulfobacteriota bacterium]
MKKLILAMLFATCPLQAAAMDWQVIDHALVADRLMPAGTEVKVRVVEISDQFDARLTVRLVQPSVFDQDKPSTASANVKTWLAARLREGDVVNYTTSAPGFVGIYAGWDYSALAVTPIERGYHLSMGYNTHRWQLVITFPDYD